MTLLCLILLYLGANCFGWMKIVLVGSKLFWSGANHFGQIQIVKISQKKSEPDQNNLDPTKTIGT